MRIEAEQCVVELVRGNGGEQFDVRASVGDFSGRNPTVEIDANAQRRFAEGLQVLERTRRGEARIEGMSPGDFQLTLRIVDPAGHVEVAGSVGRLVSFERRYRTLAMHFDFALDPSVLPELVRAVADLFQHRKT